MVRFKNRYIVIEIIPENWKDDDPELYFSTSSQQITKAFQQKIQQLHGDFGSAAIYSGFNIKYCNAYTRIAIIRCRHGPHRFIASSIPFINYLDKRVIVMKPLYTGATMKHCHRFIKDYHQRRIEIDLIKYKNKPIYEVLCKLRSSIYDV